MQPNTWNKLALNTLSAAGFFFNIAVEPCPTYFKAELLQKTSPGFKFWSYHGVKPYEDTFYAYSRCFNLKGDIYNVTIYYLYQQLNFNSYTGERRILLLFFIQ